MSLLSCIVFLASSLEPGRGDTEELQALQQISRQNIHSSVWSVCDYSLKILLSSYCLTHPHTIAKRNWFCAKLFPQIANCTDIGIDTHFFVSIQRNQFTQLQFNFRLERIVKTCYK